MARRSSFPAPLASVAALAALVVVLMAAVSGAEAYAFGPAPFHRVGYSPSSVRKVDSGVRKRRPDGSAVTLYLFPTPPAVAAANNRRPKSEARKPTQLPAMSASVLADSDVLPSFHTAHGLLSPEVVMRIADNASGHEMELDGPLHRFLKTYRRRGPMACLPLLSDPTVLPELTRAMRDIA